MATLNPAIPVSSQPDIKPMPFWQSLLYFALPALAFIIAVYWGIPAQVAAGQPVYTAYMIALLIPLVFMLAAALVAYRLEGRPLTWAGVAARFRLRPMTAKDWLWAVIGVLVGFIGFGAFQLINRVLVNAGMIPLPASIPAPIDPNVPSTVEALRGMFGPDAAGNWGLVVLAVVLLFFNIIGEEFWWRGYILPRQELAMGRWTWLVHGLMWMFFHAFKYWDWFGLFPVCLAIAYIAQRRQNTWPGIIIHLLINGSSVLLVLGVVLGLAGM